MQWNSTISGLLDTRAALAETTDRLRAELGTAEPDLVMVFLSPHHAGAHGQLAGWLGDAFGRAVVLGCTAGGVIGAGHEMEDRPALSVTAAVLPGVRVSALGLDGGTTPGGSADACRRWVGLDAAEETALVLLAEPFSCPVDQVIADLDGAYPASRQIGGLASGGGRPGQNALWLGGPGEVPALRREGLVGVALQGNLVLETLVAQGCRPIGQPLPLNRCQGHQMLELGGRPPLEVLRDLFASLPERDQELFRHSLFVGVEMNEGQIEVREGEFLIRNILGMDRESGAVAVGAELSPWQVIQFFLRDAEAAQQDLQRLLLRHSQAGGPAPAGALLFSCLGRGQGLFGRPDHDTDLFREHLGPAALGGFFCNGEIGPVGRRTFLHGYTSAFGLFRPR